MQKAHVSQKIVLYFKGVIVNTGDYSQRSRSLHLRDKRHKQFSTPQKEKNPQGKRREKRKQGARLVEALKSHITQIQNFISGKLQSPQRITKCFFTSQKITISKVVLHISKKLQLAKPFFTSQHPVKAKTTRKRKRRKRRKREKEKKKEKRKEKEKEKRGDREKIGEEGIMEKARLKSSLFEEYRPLRIRSPV